MAMGSFWGGEMLPAYRYELLAKIISCALFPCLIAIIIRIVTIAPALANNLMVHSSYEVYLIQNAAMMVASLISVSFFSYWAVSMIVVMMLACGQNLIDRSLIKVLKL